jgi:predicted permease
VGACRDLPPRHGWHARRSPDAGELRDRRAPRRKSDTGAGGSRVERVAIVTTVVGLVLLLACINVANLLLASAVARRLEFGVRLAIGASRWRIARQLLTESLLLATAGGLSGLLLSIWLVPVIARITGAPLLGDLTLDWRIYLVLAALTAGAGLATGLIPTRYALREYAARTVKGTKGTVGMTAGRPMASRAVFIGVQAAVSVLLLVVAALLTRAMVRATHVEIGFDADRLLTVAPALARMYDQQGSKAYVETALERVRALPGVQSVSLAEASPFGNASRVTIFRRAGTSYTVYYNDTRAEYFSTLGLRVVQGRTYSAAEVADKAPVAVISEKLARDFFPGEDPLGQNLDRIVDDSKAVIVGVVSDAVTARLRELSSPTIFQPLADTTKAKIVVRSQAAPDALVRSIRSALAPLDARVRLDIGLVSNGLQQQVDEPRALATLATAIALLALALAIVGLYGVTTFVVGQRRREIGVRMALGASPRDVMHLLVSDSLRPVALGLVAGLVAALIAGRVVSRTLFGVSSADPLAFGAAILILAVAATLAVVLPTRSAADIDPALSLRQL